MIKKTIALIIAVSVTLSGSAFAQTDDRASNLQKIANLVGMAPNDLTASVFFKSNPSLKSDLVEVSIAGYLTPEDFAKITKAATSLQAKGDSVTMGQIKAYVARSLNSDNKVKPADFGLFTVAIIAFIAYALGKSSGSAETAQRYEEKERRERAESWQRSF